MRPPKAPDFSFQPSDDRNITLRPVTDADEQFLFSLYAEGRRDEVAAFGWGAELAEAFLRMQFTAREAAYGFQFAGVEGWVICVNGERAGRLLVHRSDERILLVDIAVAGQYRGQRIATFAVRGLQLEAAAAGVPLVLRVDKVNTPAITLYEKLGFTRGTETDTLVEMTWKG